MRTRTRIFLGAFVLIALVATVVAIPLVRSVKANPPTASFTTTPLLLGTGSSEPEISIAQDGTMGLVSLQWLFNSPQVGTFLWTGQFGATPTGQGTVDATLQHPGKSVFGGGDADVDIGSTGRLHISTLIFLVNPTGSKAQLGVSAISCPSPKSPSFSISQCTEQIIDTTGDDRQWISSDGPHVYISYHDSGSSSVIHVQRSDDDGLTWTKVADPIVGQGGTTGDATFNNIQGKLIADPHTHNVYTVYAAGETGVLKAHTFTPNHIIVSRSSDMGKSWTANVAFTAPAGTSLGNIFPELAVDPTNGKLYAAWSDGQSVSVASSSDQGNTWTSAVTVSSTPATTAILPAIAAYNGTVDVSYYGTTATSNMDPSASWHLYFAQSTGGGFTQTQVNSSPNHLGVICTGGTGCGPGTRNLLDLFQVAIDPHTGRAGIIYVDDTLTNSNDPNNFACLPGQALPCPLPQAVLAVQN